MATEVIVYWAGSDIDGMAACGIFTCVCIPVLCPALSYLWYLYTEKQLKLEMKKEAYSSWSVKQFFPGLVLIDR